LLQNLVSVNVRILQGCGMSLDPDLSGIWGRYEDNPL
jgi:hypothetical protein